MWKQRAEMSPVFQTAQSKCGRGNGNLNVSTEFKNNCGISTQDILDAKKLDMYCMPYQETCTFQIFRTSVRSVLRWCQPGFTTSGGFSSD